MNLTIISSRISLVPLQTRMPFQYGIATMTEMPLAFVHITLDVDGARHTGTASDLLPPKWFTKVPGKPPEEEIDEMLLVIKNALSLAIDLTGDSVFQVWSRLHDAQEAWAREGRIPRLLAHFGTSLVERALIEAFARARSTPFHRLLLDNQLGIDLGRIHPSLNGLTPSQLLPPAPLPSTLARHTIGLGDPLTDADIQPQDRLDDSLPQSLAACIRTYGLKHFKIKIRGRLEEDLERLHRIANVISDEAPPDFAFSLDGNEQFKSFSRFQKFWAQLSSHPGLDRFLNRLLFIEQPLHRDQALRPSVKQALARWPNHPPIIIDESDATLAAAATALDLGYNGTSHKNCKGIFKGIGNRCLINHLNQEHPTRKYLMSGEDLCNIGPVALLQDLAVMAALGIESVERNGHHYNAGLSQLSKPIQQLTLHHHPDLYKESPLGWPTLIIHEGSIQLGSVNNSPFGTGFTLPED